MKQKLISAILLFILLVTLLLPTGATNGVSVTIDSTPVAFTQSSGSPFIDANSRTLVPLRAVMEQYGCTVGWDKDTYTASVMQNGITVLVTIGQKQISINGTTVAIDAAAQIKDGRTYLPIRAVLEAFGAVVGWENSTRTVTVLRPEKAGLRIHFIDVGQADCILITADGEAMLIDAGNNADAETITAYLRTHGVSRLKYVVGTHPHEDHIGSLDTVIDTFAVDNVLMPKAQTNTQTFEDVLDSVASKGLTVSAPKAGDTFSLGTATLTTVSNCTDTEELNNTSIMLRLAYGNTSFLFAGDAEEVAEQAALATGIPLQSDVLKVGHHGSSSSTSAKFLAAVSPDHAVISCGTGNDYGHPHTETLQALNDAGATVYRTDIAGTIVATSDGSAITWSKPGTPPTTPSQAPTINTTTYVLNTSTMKFHYPSCSSAEKIASHNKETATQDRNSLIAAGYSPCGICKP